MEEGLWTCLSVFVRHPAEERISHLPFLVEDGQPHTGVTAHTGKVQLRGAAVSWMPWVFSLKTVPCRFHSLR